jgi:hypothetical protein
MIAFGDLAQLMILDFAIVPLAIVARSLVAAITTVVAKRVTLSTIQPCAPLPLESDSGLDTLIRSPIP